MTRRLTWLAVFAVVLTVPCYTAWLLAPEGWKVLPFLIWCIGVVFLASAYLMPAPGSTAGGPSAPAVTLEDDSARRTQLRAGDE